MTTQTLAKPRQTGAQETQRAAIMNLPEKILPAPLSKLAIKLHQVKHAMDDLADYSARIERAGIDEARALESEDLSETEAMEKIATAQQQKSIFKARSTSREKAISSFSKELVTEINASSSELRGLVNAEISRRKAIIGERVTEVLQVGNSISPRRLPNELEDLLQYCGPIQEIYALAPPNYVDHGSTQNLVSAASDILSKIQRINEETGKKI